MADDFARQLLDALYNPETQPPQQPSRPLREKLAGAAETVGTLGSGLLASVPAGLAGLTQLIPTRGHRPSVNRAAQKVEDVQSALTYLPRGEAGQEYLEKTAGALGVLGMPAEFLGEQTLKLTGSPFLATTANVALDPVNYIGMPGSGKAAVATGKALGRAAAAAPRVAGEMISDIVMPVPRAQAQRGAINLGPQIPEFQPQTSAGLVSRADEALAALPRNKGTGAEFLRELEKTPGVRMAELEDRGLIEALSGMGKVTKADVLKALQDNPPVKLEEVVLGVKNPIRVEGRSLADASIAEDRKILEDAGIYPDLHPDSPDLLAFLNSADGDMVSAGELRQLVQNPEYPEVTQQVAQAAQNISDYYLGAESSKIGPAKYGRYTLPGGENYRELLLTLPSKRPSIKNMGRREYDEAVRRADEQGIRDYTTPHWDQPNVLAHARISDRTGPNGEKILHVEEVQSDWHQAGRKEGYKTGKEKEQISALSKQYDELTSRRRQLLKQAEEMPDGGPEFISLINESNAITPKLMRLQEQMDSLRSAGDRGVPDAPFKKNWHELMMRRLVDYAAKNGYDRIAITPGAEQASRYDLSKQVDEINVVGRVNALTGEKTKSVALDMKSGESLRLGVSADGTVDNVNNDSIKNFVGKKLSDVIGKDLSNKILSEDVKTLSGVDLQVGGEGMKGFYDKILPTYLNELGKPYGVKVGQMEIEIPGQEKRVFEQIPGEIWSKSVHKPKTFSTHSFAITPQMREAIKSKGLPLYAKGGSVHISDNPDTMALALQAGGVVKALSKAAKPTAEQAATMAAQRAELVLRSRAIQELKDQFENLPQPPKGFLSSESILQRMDEIRRREATPSGEQIPLLKKGGAVEMQVGGAIKSMIKRVGDQFGSYEAKRLERAADEVKNLEKLYKEEALEKLFSGDNAKAIMTMRPEDFEKFSARLQFDPKAEKQFLFEPSYADQFPPNMTQEQYIRYLANVGGFQDIPFLSLNTTPPRKKPAPFVTGHEGRHRSRALVEASQPTSIVQLFPDPMLRESMPRRYREDFISALNEELERTNRMVRPQREGADKKVRPLIQLPPAYKDGGSVKKGAKVKFTDNLDTMRLAVQKRK